ncbi:MAG: GAF domain-containing protein [Deltaproteobacteria bacterium]|nr:GAF domain-containing protein [Deltaproteobacteria bacterium]
MATKYWKVEISRLGASDPLFLGTVEAATWPAALQAGRAKIGESGGVPAGASCNVNPNGTVTIQDSLERRRYQIVPAAAPAPPPGTKRPVPSRPEMQAPVAPAPTPATATNGSARKSTPPPSPEAVRQRRASVPRPTSPPPATVENKLILLASRDEKPTISSPIHFRERMYAVPVPLQPGTGEKLATKLLRRAQEEISRERGAKFIRIELFDHIWKASPDHSPVVRIEWKDWNKSIEIEFPLEEDTRHSEAPRVSSVPPPPTEDRLAVAFEACHDLLFLKNRAEALEFAVHLLEELVPSEATAAFLLDINTDEFRVVAARGTGARARQGQALPSSSGLLAAASTLAEHAVLVLADAAADPRYDEHIDGVPGLDVRALLYRPLIHRGRMFGVLQLANGVGREMFTESDCEVVDYVTQQLSVFVARGASLPKAAAAQH